MLAVVVALLAAGMPALTRTFRGYPRGSLSGGQQLIPWVVLIPVVVLIVVGVLRFARGSEYEHRDDADTHRDTGDTGDSSDSGGGCQDDVRPRRIVMLAVAIALVTLAFGAAYYITAVGPR
jgi:hypothetical protein